MQTFPGGSNLSGGDDDLVLKQKTSTPWGVSDSAFQTPPACGAACGNALRGRWRRATLTLPEGTPSTFTALPLPLSGRARPRQPSQKPRVCLR